MHFQEENGLESDIGLQIEIGAFSFLKPAAINISFQIVRARGSSITVTGCIILLQFAPRLSRAGGSLGHPEATRAMATLSQKLTIPTWEAEGKFNYVSFLLCFERRKKSSCDTAPNVSCC